MTIARGQMNRQLYAEGGIRSLRDILEPRTREMLEEYLPPMEERDYIPELRKPQRSPEPNLSQPMPGDHLRTGPRFPLPRRLRDERFRKMDEELREYEPTEDEIEMLRRLPRRQYGLGSFVKKALGSVKKVLDPVAQVASFIPGPHQPFATAYTTARGAGLGGGGYGGLKIGGFAPTGGFFSSIGLPQIGNVGEGITSAFSRNAAPSLLTNTGGMEAVVRGASIPGNLSGTYNPGSIFSTLGNLGTDFSGSAKVIIDKLGKAVTDNPFQALGTIGNLVASGYTAKLSYDDQKRINELQQQAYDNYQAAKAEKRSQYYGESGAKELPQLEVSNRTRSATGGRIGFAAGGRRILKGIKNLLDEAYEMVSSRGDFDFSDYKMRGQQMAEELAQLKFNKDYDDLDLNTQMDLYEVSSDYLNDVAADAADNMRDMMKERFGKAEGGIMDLNVRTNPEGVQELDMREEGGFIPPIGIKEKADDIPAMLSNNEFVFTADAVRAAGGGSVNKGAEKMYALMKQLEGQA